MLFLCYLSQHFSCCACAEQIAALIRDPDFCKALGRQGKQSVEAYGLERVLPLVTKAYESLLAPTGNE